MNALYLSERPYMSDRRMTPLPPAIIPFLLENLDGFDVMLEEGERIIITPKSGAQVSPASRQHLLAALSAVPRPKNPIGRAQTARPRFTYKARDARYTPDQAKAFGMSKPRLKIYELIHAAGEAGVGYKMLREKSHLPHGSVMQILHWLRKQKLITGEPDV